VAGMIIIYEACCEHFGLHVGHTAADFLPAPDVPEIRMEKHPPAGAEEAAIHTIVQQVYVINRDDFNMREILLQPEDGQAAWFDGLRKNYPVGREFQNTKNAVTGIDRCLVNKLAGIGFKVAL